MLARRNCGLPKPQAVLNRPIADRCDQGFCIAEGDKEAPVLRGFPQRAELITGHRQMQAIGLRGDKAEGFRPHRWVKDAKRIGDLRHQPHMWNRAPDGHVRKRNLHALPIARVKDMKTEGQAGFFSQALENYHCFFEAFVGRRQPDQFERIAMRILRASFSPIS